MDEKSLWPLLENASAEQLGIDLPFIRCTLDRWLSPWVAAGMAVAGACTSAPQTPASAPPVLDTSVGVSASARPLARASASASASEVSAASASAPGASELPPAPPRVEVQGTAAIVWIADDKVEPGGHRSVLIEPDAIGTRVVAERRNTVFVGSTDLWVLEVRTFKILVCAECEKCRTTPPDCKKNASKDAQAPLFRSLRTNKRYEPWQRDFGPGKGCGEAVADVYLDVEIAGGVGSIVFATVHNSEQHCGGAHPLWHYANYTVDLDTLTVLDLAFPPQVAEPLRKRAHQELSTGGCVTNPEEIPKSHRATARYNERGELEGVYSYTMSALYMCGTGPGHYSMLSEQKSDWLPHPLERWGKLPSWVAQYMAASQGVTAFVISAERAQAARAEFGRK